MDPLLASGHAERLAARQIHEPLVSLQSGPFGQTRQRPGLIRSFDASAGDTVWTAKLRSGVRFQGGAPFDADAVLANVERWLASPTARELLPELIVADNPQPGVVRFQLDRPSPDFPRRLDSARLGIVAPAALSAAGGGAVPLTAGGSGTGPFELREQGAGRLLLARNASWWGTPLGLGPGVDQIELIDLPPQEGLEQLESGSVEISAVPDARLARDALRDPLLTVVRGGGLALAMERSVRGVESGDVDQPLADAWLTDLG